MFLLTDIALGTAISGIKLSIDLCRGLISTVYSKNMNNSSSNINSNEVHYINLSKLLEDYDIEYTLSIIETFCKEFENKIKIKSNNEDENKNNTQDKEEELKSKVNKNDSLHLCLNGIHNSIDILTNNLQIIHKNKKNIN